MALGLKVWRVIISRAACGESKEGPRRARRERLAVASSARAGWPASVCRRFDLMKKLFQFVNNRSALRPATVCAVFLALLSGCATAPKREPPKPTFFPPPPDEPRIQFLTAFSSDVGLGRRGSFAEYVTGATAPPNKLIKPYGLALSGGKIFVCDTMASAVEVFDLAKKRARYFAPSGESHLQTPINITIDADGTRYIADTGRNQVLIFARDDSYVGAIGTQGEMRPCDVGLTADRLYVADLKGHAVRVYGKADRKLLFTVPRDPKADQGRLFSPSNLAIDKERGRLLVTDTGGCAVQVYDLDGKHLSTIGAQGVGPGLFARPKGLAVDRAGRVYVADAYVDVSGARTELVQSFDPEGRLLMLFGQPGASTAGELSMPADVAIDYDHIAHYLKYVAPGYQCEYLILVTSQFGSRMVNVYGFVKKK